MKRKYSSIKLLALTICAIAVSTLFYGCGPSREEQIIVDQRLKDSLEKAAPHMFVDGKFDPKVFFGDKTRDSMTAEPKGVAKDVIEASRPVWTWNMLNFTYKDIDRKTDTVKTFDKFAADPSQVAAIIGKYMDQQADFGTGKLSTDFECMNVFYSKLNDKIIKIIVYRLPGAKKWQMYGDYDVNSPSVSLKWKERVFVPET